MTSFGISFQPFLPWWLPAIAAVLALTLVILGWWQSARGIWVRALLLAAALLVLMQPVLREEQRQMLNDIVLAVIDQSPSQNLDDRQARSDEAFVALTDRLRDERNIELVVRSLPGDESGTNIRPMIDDALLEIDRDRLSGVLLITDGQLHDLKRSEVAPLSDAPVHVLLSGRRDETDRRLVIEKAPTFAMVGEPQSLEIRIEEQGLENAGEAVPVAVRQNGELIAESSIVPGETRPIDFQLDKAGRSLIEIEAASRDGELTTINNRATIEVNGIRDRLRVLLVSGRPYPGLRVWRNLLKADPAVDLVHFTILRPPEKQDGTPIRELALIAFPSHELFEEKIDEFDLVIFDRYSRRGLLPLVYLDNVARYVENGGALLEAAGPEFAGSMSLFRTPLARVLPGQPSGEVHNRAFKPLVTELGRRHPVTRELTDTPDNPDWSGWYRQVDVDVPDGQVVMTGVGDRPLLALSRVGEGRVAQLLSDHHWLWARGVDGGGPQSLLLRRLVHWLMKEPELEEEQLRARGERGSLIIERRSIDGEPHEVLITSPTGTVSSVTLEPDATGVGRLEIDVLEDGVFRIEDGERVAYAMPRDLSRIELEDLRSTGEHLASWIDQAGGTVRWLDGDPLPDIRMVGRDRAIEGRGWIGFVQNEHYLVEGLRDTQLLPPWLSLGALLALSGLVWWREGRG